jgi:hypothetical protein
LDKDFISEVKAIAYYNLAQIYNEAKKNDLAINNYKASLEFSRLDMKPIIWLGYYSIAQEDDIKISILIQLSKEIIDNNLIPTPYDPEKQMVFNLEHLKEILVISFLHSYSEFEKLKSWLSYLGEKSLSEHLYELALFLIYSKEDWNTAIDLFNKIYDNFSNDEYNVDETVKYNTLQILAFVDGKKSEEYIPLFSYKRIKQIDYLDFSIFANLIAVLVSQKRYNESLEYIQIINSVKNEVSKELQINYLAIYNLELNANYYLKNIEIAREKAKEILELCNDEAIKKQKSNLLGDTGLEVIRKNAEDVLYPHNIVRQPIKVEKKYGPNEWIRVKYADGRIENIKYKKVKDDINGDKCVIINE